MSFGNNFRITHVLIYPQTKNCIPSSDPFIPPPLFNTNRTRNSNIHPLPPPNIPQSEYISSHDRKDRQYVLIEGQQGWGGERRGDVELYAVSSLPNLDDTDGFPLGMGTGTGTGKGESSQELQWAVTINVVGKPVARSRTDGCAITTEEMRDHDDGSGADIIHLLPG